MINKIQELISTYKKISHDMSVPNIMDNIQKYSTLAKEYRRLTPIVEIGEKYISINSRSILKLVPNRMLKHSQGTCR